MAVPSPPPQVCPLCGHDDDVNVVPSGSDTEWLFACTNHAPPYNWAVPHEVHHTGREGITAELGLYDDLLLCIEAGDPWVEHGIVEYRYRQLRPAIYVHELVARFGHRAQGPRHFSASALIAKALGQLRNEGLLAWQYAQATGFWDYNGTISYWATVPPPPEDQRLTWEIFAVANHLDPRTWVIEE